MNADQIRAEVEAAKREAAKGFDRQFGAGAFAALKAFNESPEGRAQRKRALDDICRAAGQ